MKQAALPDAAEKGDSSPPGRKRPLFNRKADGFPPPPSGAVP